MPLWALVQYYNFLDLNNWYHLLCDMSLEEKERDVVRLSELEMGSSTSDKPMETKVDTAALRPSSSKPSSTKVRTFP